MCTFSNTSTNNVAVTVIRTFPGLAAWTEEKKNQPGGTGEPCSCCGGIRWEAAACLASSCPQRAPHSWGVRWDSWAAPWSPLSMPSPGSNKWLFFPLSFSLKVTKTFTKCRSRPAARCRAPWEINVTGGGVAVSFADWLRLFGSPELVLRFDRKGCCQQQQQQKKLATV